MKKCCFKYTSHFSAFLFIFFNVAFYVQAQAATSFEVVGGNITADARVIMNNCPEPVILTDYKKETAIIDPILPVSANTLAEANQGGCHALVESAVDFDPSSFSFTAGSTLEIFSESTYSAIASFPEASINFRAKKTGSINFLAETVVNFSGSSHVAVTITESSSSTVVLTLIWDGSKSYSVPFNVINGEVYNLNLSTNFTEHSIGSTHSFALSLSISESSAEDTDGDGVVDLIDNCLDVSNPDQADRDSDFIGDVCDPFPDDRDNEKAQCAADLAQALDDLQQCLNTCTPTHKNEKGPRCTDGLDNDCDGMIDSVDPDCQ